MIKDLVESGVPIIVVETPEPSRVYKFLPELDYDVVGEWTTLNGLALKSGGRKHEPSKREKSFSAALDYLRFANQKHFVLFLNPHFETTNLVSEIRQHCLVLAGQRIPHIVGEVRVKLPEPDEAEYQEAFAEILKPKKNKALCKLHSKCAHGMLVSEAVNCFQYTARTNTDFLKNRHLFVNRQVIDFVDSPVSFKDVGGLWEFKNWFNTRKYLYTDEAHDYGLRFPRGAVLYKESGCGKSLIAKALGNESGLPLVRFDLTKVYNQFVGASEAEMRAALESIERVSPCICWIEELGRLIVGKDSQGDSGTTSRLLAMLLTWLQEHGKDIFVVATVNDIENIPEALLRKGRFSEIFEVQAPDRSARREIWQIHIEKYGLDICSYSVLDVLAEKSQGMTGADIEAAVEDTMISCYCRGVPKKNIVGEYFEAALNDTQ